MQDERQQAPTQSPPAAKVIPFGQPEPRLYSPIYPAPNSAFDQLVDADVRSLAAAGEKRAAEKQRLSDEARDAHPVHVELKAFVLANIASSTARAPDWKFSRRCGVRCDEYIETVTPMAEVIDSVMDDAAVIEALRALLLAAPVDAREAFAAAVGQRYADETYRGVKEARGGGEAA